MYIFSFSFPYYTKVTYYRYSLYFKFFHLKIIPGNHSLSVNKTYPHYFFTVTSSSTLCGCTGLGSTISCVWAFKLFPVFAVANNAAMNKLLNIIFLLLELYLQGKFLEGKFLGQKLAANVILSDAIKSLSTRLVCTHSHFQQQCMRVPKAVPFLKIYKDFFYH